MRKVTIAAIIIGFPLAFATYSTFSSVVTAPSRVVSKTLQTNNIIFNYERFYDMNARYQARLSQFKQYEELFANETDRAEKIKLRTEMAAIQQSCRDLATQYNADSQKINRSIFKSNNLPYELEIC